MVLDTKTQSIAWMEYGLRIPLKRYALSMENKMAVEAVGRAKNYPFS